MAKKADSGAGFIRFKCYKCGSPLKVSDKLGGRYLTCPKCKQRTGVPESQAAADEEAGEYIVKSHAVDVPDHCAKCNAKIPRGSVICVECGYNYREGKQLVVEDHTLKEGEPVRGMPALQMVIAEIVFLLAFMAWPIVRDVYFGGYEWWEVGVAAGFCVYLLAGIVAHFLQWTSYRQIPLRDHAGKLIEDRAEREEARKPFGAYTFVILFLLVGGSVGICYLTIGPGGEQAPGQAAPAPEAEPGGNDEAI